MKQQIAAFDFDGTITNKDTFLEFIKFTEGSIKFYMVFLLFSPLLVAYKLKLYPNWKIKQQIFSFIYKGKDRSTFNNLCKNFFLQVGKGIIKPQAIEHIKKCQKEKTEILIVSASIENWITPFAQYLNIKTVLATKIETNANDKITGRFTTPNCYGMEKVNRISQLFPNRNDYTLSAYGDSKGDKALLAFADKRFYRFKECH